MFPSALIIYKNAQGHARRHESHMSLSFSPPLFCPALPDRTAYTNYRTTKQNFFFIFSYFFRGGHQLPIESQNLLRRPPRVVGHQSQMAGSLFLKVYLDLGFPSCFSGLLCWAVQRLPKGFQSCLTFCRFILFFFTPLSNPDPTYVKITCKCIPFNVKVNTFTLDMTSSSSKFGLSKLICRITGFCLPYCIPACFATYPAWACSN